VRSVVVVEAWQDRVDDVITETIFISDPRVEVPKLSRCSR